MKNFIILILIALSVEAFSQCAPTFTATQGAGGNVTFNLTSPPTTGVSAIVWRFGDGTQDSTLSFTITHTYPFNYPFFSVEVFVYNSSLGCSDSLTQVIAVTTSPQNSSCLGGAVFSVFPSGSATTFQNNNGVDYWEIIDWGDGYPIAGTTSNPILNHQYNINGSYTVTSVAYTVYNGLYIACDTFITTITVNNVACEANIYGFADYNNGSLFCNASFSQGINNYTWYINGVFTANTFSFQTPNNYPQGLYTVTLVGSGPSGCIVTDDTTLNLTYTVYCPGISFTDLKLAGCDDYQFNAFGLTGSNTITWSVDNTVVSASPNPIINVPFPSGQNAISHEVISYVTGPGGCIAGRSFVYDNPAGFKYTTDTIAPVVWYVTPNSTSFTVASHLWDFGDGFTSTLATPSHTYANAGTYNLCHTITSTTGCTYDFCYSNYFFRPSSSPVQVIVLPQITGIEEDFKETALKLFPNPANDKLYIETNATNVQSCVICSLDGKQVFNQEFQTELNVANLNSGLYILELRNQQNQSVVRKLFVKE